MAALGPVWTMVLSSLAISPFIQLVVAGTSSSTSAAGATPINFLPSLEWFVHALFAFSPVQFVNHYREGDDGSWSTFNLQIGTPPQNVRVLPSITDGSIWAVLPQGCGSSDPSDCPNMRGGTF